MAGDRRFLKLAVGIALSAIAILAALPVAPAATDAGPAEEPPRFVTTPFLEPDRCATAWVILRHVAPEAIVSFHEREAMPPDAEPFDLPEAELRRDARRTTLEVLVQREGLDDPFVDRLARLVHDVEINAWATRREPGSRKFETVLMDEFRAAASPEEALATCLDLLDRLRDAGGRLEDWPGAPREAPAGRSN